MGIFKKVQNIFQNKDEKTNLSEKEVQKDKNAIISNNEDKLSKSLKRTKESFFGKLAKKISGKNRFILLDKIGKAFINDKLDNKYLKEISKNFIR